MRQIRTITPLAAVLASLLLAQAGQAAPHLVPPGVSGANQYTETLPGPGGNEPTGGNGAGHGPKNTAKALGGKNAHDLEALGPEGKRAAELAAGGAAAVAASGAKGSSGKSLNSANDGSSGLSQVLGNLSGADSGDEGMGILLPGLILIFGIAAAVTGVAKYRARTQH